MELTDIASFAASFAGRRLRGVGVSPGTACGPVVRMGDVPPVPTDEPRVRPASDELERARSAMAAVASDLRARGAMAEATVRGVLDAQALIAEDRVMADDVARRIDAGATAARAIWEAFDVFGEGFRGGGGYLAERAADLDDVRNRLVAACLGVPLPQIPSPGHPFVLTARTLSPADTATLHPDQVLAIVTVDGGPTSHTAILARALGIPAVVGCNEAIMIPDGTPVMVDGGSGTVEVSDGVTRAHVPVASPGASPCRGQTSDGIPIALLANIGRPEESASAVAAGAEGVGLLRTEFLYSRAEVPPSVSDQESALRAVLSAFASQLVVVRLLDAGGDKPLPFLPGAGELNPALGMRGLRALRAHPHILDDQLEAIFRAAASCTARVAVMAPMVTDARDAEWFAARVRAHPGWRSEVAIGVMIETPAAALTAESLVAAGDLVSIGTNDLTQYVMAADRSLAALSDLQSPWHPAVLELVARVAEAGRRAGKPVGVCGEAAANPLLALVLVGLGVTQLSMTWSALDGVRSMLARCSFAQCSSLAAAALAAHDADDALARVQSLAG